MMRGAGWQGRTLYTLTIHMSEEGEGWSLGNTDLKASHLFQEHSLFFLSLRATDRFV